MTLYSLYIQSLFTQSLFHFTQLQLLRIMGLTCFRVTRKIVGKISEKLFKCHMDVRNILSIIGKHLTYEISCSISSTHIDSYFDLYFLLIFCEIL